MKTKKYFFRCSVVLILWFLVLYLFGFSTSIISQYGIVVLLLIFIYYIFSLLDSFFDFSRINKISLPRIPLHHIPGYAKKNFTLLVQQRIFSKWFRIALYSIINYYTIKYLFVIMIIICAIVILEFLFYGQSNLRLIPSLVLFFASLYVAWPDIKKNGITFGKYTTTRKIVVGIIIFILIYFVVKITV